MVSAEKIVVLMFSSYFLFGGIWLLIWNNSMKDFSAQNSKKVQASKDKKTNQFDDEFLQMTKDPKAQDITTILSLLGAYTDAEHFLKIPPNYSKPHLGLINDDSYCFKADKYNLENPRNMFVNKNFFTDYAKGLLPRKMIMEKIGKIPMPQISAYMSKKTFNSRKYELSLEITNFFVNMKAPMHSHHKVGSHFLGVTQMYNHIPGNSDLVRKDSFLECLNNYTEKFKGKPQCFSKEKYFPKFYRFFNKKECKAFFNLTSSEEYKQSVIDEPIQFLVKVSRNSHKGEGVFILDEKQLVKLNKDYKNGLDCGKNKSPLVAQAYINHPLLLDMDNKFDFRIYVLIASTNPLIVYYHDGFLRVALTPFNLKSSNLATHLTNTHLANQVIAKAEKAKTRLNNMTKAQLDDYHLWSFKKLQDYLLKSGKITDKNWLDNYLRPTFHKAIIHIIKMTSHSFMNTSNVYEIHGVDFILDDQMQLWFIESNPSPLLTGTPKYKVYYETISDALDIMYAYYRSRMKRLVELIKKIGKSDISKPKNLDYWREEYQKAMKNRFDPEYLPSKKNSFQLIIDENLPGAEAYFGYVTKDCVLN